MEQRRDFVEESWKSLLRARDQRRRPAARADGAARAVLNLLRPWPFGEQVQPKREGSASIGDGVPHTPHGADDVAIGDGLQLEADVIDV